MSVSAALSAALYVWDKVHARHTFPVVGWSMWPLLRPGDSVVVQHGNRDLRPGDLVVYRRGEGLIVHRLVQMGVHQRTRLLHTQGDNRPQGDPPVHPTDVVGRVVAIRRGEHLWPVDGWFWRRLGLLLRLRVRLLEKLR